MNNQDLIDFLKGFREGEVYAKLKAVKEERIAEAYKISASPMADISGVLNHSRLGGMIEGLQFDEIEVLLEDLENGNKPIQENKKG